jgi:hypothetical protein
LAEISVLDRTPAYIATSIESRGEEDILNETRSEEFSAKIEDKSEVITDIKPVEEFRLKAPDYSSYENEIILLNLKGALNK